MAARLNGGVQPPAAVGIGLASARLQQGRQGEFRVAGETLDGGLAAVKVPVAKLRDPFLNFFQRNGNRVKRKLRRFRGGLQLFVQRDGPHAMAAGGKLIEAERPVGRGQGSTARRPDAN